MLIQEITMRNFLSYGPDGDALSLKPLNIIIGPNGSGKSNLMEAMALLRSAPTRFDSLIRKGGRVTEWLWKGGRTSVTAKLEAVIASDALKTALPIRYGFDFTESGGRFEIVDEHIENAEVFPGDAEPYFYYRHENGHPVLNVQLEKISPAGPRFFAGRMWIPKNPFFKILLLISPDKVRAASPWAERFLTTLERMVGER